MYIYLFPYRAFFHIFISFNLHMLFYFQVRYYYLINSTQIVHSLFKYFPHFLYLDYHYLFSHFKPFLCIIMSIYFKILLTHSSDFIRLIIMMPVFSFLILEIIISSFFYFQNLQFTFKSFHYFSIHPPIIFATKALFIIFKITFSISFIPLFYYHYILPFPYQILIFHILSFHLSVFKAEEGGLNIQIKTLFQMGQ